MEKESLKQERVVETCAEDMAHVIEDNQGGLVKQMIHEEEMKQIQNKNVSPVSQKNKIYILLSAIFLIGAFLTFVFLFLQEKKTSVIVEPQFAPIIYNDKNVFLEIADLPRDKILESMATEASNTTVKKGGIEGIYVIQKKQIVGLRSFLSLIKSNLSLPNRDLVSDNFMTGVFNSDTKDFFILVKIRSFQDIFDNMRTWENKMFYDLHTLFGVPINISTKYLLTKNFDDQIVENKNARVLHDDKGNIVFMYIFADDNSLVITNTVDAVHELITRLSGSQIRK